MNPEQTFHTPSFGDEDFDLLPLGLEQQGMDPNNSAGMTYLQQQPQMSQVHQMMPPPSQPVTHYVQNPAEVYGQDSMYMTSISSDDMSVSQNYNDQVASQQQYQMEMNMVMGGGGHHPQQQQHNPVNNVMMSGVSSTVAPTSGFLTTISQAQLSSQLGLHFGGVTQQQQQSNSSPRSNQTSSPGQETSEDSDDNVHQLGHLIGGLAAKRPSPEPAVGSSKSVTKKPKATKKKKKRDPNEPQKPVSAYALFFRDTQAAIKGQNPNASFGEVSKIVASMWDTLDEDHKNVYKKRTEVAKKEYLKALAAYRASLVSKGVSDHSEYGATSTSVSSPSLSPPVTSTVSSSSSSYVIGSGPIYASVRTIGLNNVNSGNGVGGGCINNNSPPQELSPLQKKSPLLTSLMEGSNSNSGSPPDHTSMSPPLTNAQMHSMQLSPPSQQLQQRLHIQQTPMRMISPMAVQHHHQQHPPSTAPYSSVGMVNSGNLNLVQGVEGGQSQQLMNFDRMASGTCLRNGCTNPTIDSTEWDSEYCSNDCVVSHCRDVFTAWVASRQATNSYASVK
ncbi:hypothetical protein CHUAL_003415 [Chamberlinius hualienensis]